MLCYVSDFMMGLVCKSKLCTKFEIGSFSYYINIKGELQIFESSPEAGHAHVLSFSVIFVIGLGKPKLYTKLEVASFSHYRNTKRDPKSLGAPVAQSHAHFSSGCDFMMDVGKLQLHTELKSLASSLTEI